MQNIDVIFYIFSKKKMIKILLKIKFFFFILRIKPISTKQSMLSRMGNKKRKIFGWIFLISFILFIFIFIHFFHFWRDKVQMPLGANFFIFPAIRRILPSAILPIEGEIRGKCISHLFLFFIPAKTQPTNKHIFSSPFFLRLFNKFYFLQ